MKNKTLAYVIYIISIIIAGIILNLDLNVLSLTSFIGLGVISHLSISIIQNEEVKE